jgi:hypothetical protein
VEQLRRKKYRFRNHRTSEVEQLKKRKYKQRKHRTLKKGVRKRKNHKELMNKNMWRLFQQHKKRYPKYFHFIFFHFTKILRKKFKVQRG